MSILSYVQSSIQSFLDQYVKPHPATKKYNLLSKKGNNHLLNVPEFNELIGKPQAFEFDEEHNFTSVFLTEKQAAHLRESVAAFGDHFEEEAVITLPPNRYFEKDVTLTSTDPSTQSTPQTATNGILLDIPKYPGTIKGVDVIVLDTLMVTNAPQFAGFDVSVEKSFVGDKPCEAHGTNVGEIIASGIDPSKTDLQIKNVAVFDCHGSTTTSILVNALQAILAYKKGPGKDRQLVVNFSGGGPQSNILDTLFAKLSKNNISIVVAAGNSGQICTMGSPANVSKSSNLQSIGALGKKGDPVGYRAGQDLATYSNYATPAAKCVDEYYQGCYELADPFTGKVGVGCGTSFAAPVGTLRRVVYQATNPRANQEQAKQAFKQETVPAIGPDGITVNAITPTMAFDWSNKQAQGLGKGALKAHAKDTTTDHAKHTAAPKAKMA